MFKKYFFNDLRAGIVVFLVALPLCLGISLACNAPPLSGIITGIIGGIVVTAFSGSVLSVSGPAAGLTSIIVASVSVLGSYELFLAAVVFAGLLQIIFGLVKAGNFGNYIPGSVIKGMLAGIGIILIIKQLPHLLGCDLDPEGDLDFDQSDGHNSFSELLYMFGSATPGCVFIGVLCLLTMVISRFDFYKQNKFLSSIPGPLVTVAFGILLSISFRNNSFLSLSADHLVDIPVLKDASVAKDVLIFPDFSMLKSAQFWIIAATLAFVASTESLLSVEATDKLDPLKRNSDFNKEFMAQGIGNIVAGLLGGLPLSAVIVRSSANVNAGAKTKMSAISHGVLLLLCVFLLPDFLNLIPNAALASILIYTGYKLCNISLFKEQYKKGIDQFLPFMVTLCVMLITDLMRGIAAGSVVAIIFIIRNSILSSFDVVEDVIDGKKHYMMKLPTHLTFFNKGTLNKFLRGIEKKSKVIIDGTINKTTDAEIREVFKNFMETTQQKNIEVELIKYKLN